MRRAGIAIVLALIPATDVLANGLTTHVWISRRAVELLPEGELKAILSKPDLRDYLVSGTIFPDGGYAAGDGYGELAHWEPFQVGYLEYIRTTYGPSFSDPEAEKHLAFLFGLASHGMADQIFDSLYMQRGHEYDAASDWVNKSFDEATDVIWASKTGAQPVPPRWVPTEVFIDLFDQTGSHVVTAETMLRGQNLAGFAVSVVGMLAQDREAVRDYSLQFPWATSHLDDALVPGRPEEEAAIIAEYWQRHWARLHGAPPATEAELILGTISPRGTSSKSVESRITIAFARRFAHGGAPKEMFAIEDAGGRAIAFDTWLYYGGDSHVVHLVPSEELAAGATYTVTIRAGLEFKEGVATPEDYAFAVSTKPITNAGEQDGCVCVRGSGSGSPGLGLIVVLLGFCAAKRPTGRRASK